MPISLLGGSDTLYQFLLIFRSAKEGLPNFETLHREASRLNSDYVLGLTDKEIENTCSLFMQREGVRPPDFHILKLKQEDYWFSRGLESKDFDLHYGQRYKDFLTKHEHFGSSVVNQIEKTSIQILNLCADPRVSEKSSKFGMVVGDVQAGKTSNYLYLINIAIDAGYKNIVLLAGLNEDLRRQTQRRVDEALLGAFSESFGQGGDPIYAGVGKIGCGGQKDTFAVSFTTYDHDFVKSTAEAMAAKPGDYKKPTISVVKKNVKVLESLRDFVTGSADMEKLPLLVIDDECDNASINISSEDSPSAINKAIRDLLQSYRISTYVGFTATPYANIFIDPDAEYKRDETGEVIELPDLFPRDFIIQLDSPSNYFGIENLFSGFAEDGSSQCTKQVIKIGESEDANFLPVKHKKDFIYPGLSKSLREAVIVFLISSSIYTMRGNKNQHRSMMINISRFNDMQELIEKNVSQFVEELKNGLESYGAKKLDAALKSRTIQEIYNVWQSDKYFRANEDIHKLSFSEILEVMYEEICQFVVTIYYGRRKSAERFKYDDYKETGARVIVIGGFVLSRGLTLSGLMVSYYSRNASAYDVLLQMGRWFGYRDGYVDLCHIFMPQIAIDSFCAVAEATNDLKSQFKRLADSDATPMQFGLMVREAPESLDTRIAITARTKSRSAEEAIFPVQLSGSTIDTSKIDIDLSSALKNGQLIKDFLMSLQTKGISTICSKTMLSPEKQYFKDVQKLDVLNFLGSLSISTANNVFDIPSLVDFIQRSDELERWNIVVASGSGDKFFQVGGLKFKTVLRGFKCKPGEKFVRIGGKNNRLLDPGIFKIDLTPEDLAKVEKKAKDAVSHGERKDDTPIASDYLAFHKNPVLVIYPIILKSESAGDAEEEIAKKRKIIEDLNNSMIFGFAIGFPGAMKKKLAYYKINIIKSREINSDFREDLGYAEDSDNGEN